MFNSFVDNPFMDSKLMESLKKHKECIFRKEMGSETLNDDVDTIKKAEQNKEKIEKEKNAKDRLNKLATNKALTPTEKAEKSKNIKKTLSNLKKEEKEKLVDVGQDDGEAVSEGIAVGYLLKDYMKLVKKSSDSKADFVLGATTDSEYEIIDNRPLVKRLENPLKGTGIKKTFGNTHFVITKSYMDKLKSQGNIFEAFKHHVKASELEVGTTYDIITGIGPTLAAKYTGKTNNKHKFEVQNEKYKSLKMSYNDDDISKYVYKQ